TRSWRRGRTGRSARRSSGCPIERRRRASASTSDPRRRACEGAGLRGAGGRGRVAPPAGRPWTGTVFAARSKDGWWAAFALARPDADGRFVLAPLPAGGVELSAIGDDGTIG